jgi:hypothetical protein
MIFNGIHGAISQKIVLFITTAVTTSDPTNITLITVTIAATLSKSI